MKGPRTGDLIGAIIGNIVAIAFVNTVPLWSPWTAGAITDRWVDILWAANLSLAVQIGGSFLLLFYHPPRFHAFIRLLFAAASLLSLIVFYIVFPLEFSQLVGSWLNSLLRVLLMVGMAGTLVSGVVQLVRLLVGGRGGE